MKSETTMTICKNSVLNRGCRIIVLSCVSLFAIAPLVAVGDTISVLRGETLGVSTATPVTAMDVHGTLNVQGTLAIPAEIIVDSRSTATSATTGA